MPPFFRVFSCPAPAGFRVLARSEECRDVAAGEGRTADFKPGRRRLTPCAV